MSAITIVDDRYQVAWMVADVCSRQEEQLMDSDASFVGGQAADTSFAAGSSANVQAAAIPNRIAVEDFTEAVFRAVTRAVDTRKLPLGPLIYGIIWDPQFRNVGRGPGIVGPQAESEEMGPGM